MLVSFACRSYRGLVSFHYVVTVPLLLVVLSILNALMLVFKKGLDAHFPLNSQHAYVDHNVISYTQVWCTSSPVMTKVQKKRY